MVYSCPLSIVLLGYIVELSACDDLTSSPSSFEVSDWNVNFGHEGTGKAFFWKVRVNLRDWTV